MMMVPRNLEWKYNKIVIKATTKVMIVFIAEKSLICPIRITNSAIDDESGKSSIKSVGEHRISVIPLEEDQLV